MDKGEPSSCNLKFPQFLIGKNGRGNWVVRDIEGLHGGLFIDRAEALKFAKFGNGNHPQTVIMVPGILELDMSNKSRSGHACVSTDQRAGAA